MKSTDNSTEVWIAGDVYPAPLPGDDLATRLQVRERPDLFLWTLDAAVPAGPRRAGVTCLPFAPASLDGLSLGKSNYVVTASNHMSDFGDEGLRATLDALESRGFQHVGAGLDRATAERNADIELPAGRVAVLAYAEMHPRVSALAPSDTHGGVRPFEINACLEAIREAKQQADWVWIVLHWGEEFVRFPDPDQRRMAWQMVDAGADLVVASHTHVPLGFERRGEAAIFYGLGNFLFPPYLEARGYRYNWHPSARQGVIAAGRYENGRWCWQPKEVRLSAAGLPRLAAHGNCPDYAGKLPAELAPYADRFGSLRRRERYQFFAERLCFMSWQERAFRLRRLVSRNQESQPQ